MGDKQGDHNWPRVVSLEEGVAMVVTDLHGDWDLYRRYRDRFLELEASGQADILVFTGDLIHSDGPPEKDRSLDIVLDVLALRERLGERLVYLLGNHEFPHLYNFVLQRGDLVYTPPFEAAMGAHRPAIVDLFHSLPLYARTRAGVSFCHAGAFPEARDPDVAERVFRCSHRRIWEETAATLPADQRASLRAGLGKLSRESYDQMARRDLAVTGPDDPRYDDLLIGAIVSSVHPDFSLLWSALFNRNEWEHGKHKYARYVQALLARLASGFSPQTVLVTGHMACRGYARIAGLQLRMASGAHAHPPEAARYLLFDVARPVEGVDDLLDGLESVFD